MIVSLLASVLFAVGSYWSIAPDGSLILVTPPSVAAVEIVEIVIEEPPATGTIKKLPGPWHYGPHGTCKMCEGNHILAHHGCDRSYLDSIGSGAWLILHSNLHNDPAFRGHDTKTRGKGSMYGMVGSSRRPLFWRLRRR